MRKGEDRMKEIGGLMMRKGPGKIKKNTLLRKMRDLKE